MLGETNYGIRHIISDVLLRNCAKYDVGVFHDLKARPIGLKFQFRKFGLSRNSKSSEMEKKYQIVLTRQSAVFYWLSRS